jgi:hypothetical protein
MKKTEKRNDHYPPVGGMGVDYDLLPLSPPPIEKSFLPQVKIGHLRSNI